MAGSFIRDQALAIGKYHRQARVVISLWGNEGTKLNFEHPREILPHLINHVRDKSYFRKIAPRVFEFNQPAMEWSVRVFRGNVSSIIEANKINFQKAQKKFGKINLIHAHVSFPAGFVAMKLAEEFKLPYIITEHMGPFPLQPFANNSRLMPLVLGPLKKANLVIVVSSKLQQELSKFKIKSMVIPNLINENFFTLDSSPKTTDKFIYFSLGEIRPEKGFEDLIKAIAIVLKKDNEILFRLGGQGKFLKKYQEQTENLKISQNLVWLGQLSRKKVLEEMQKCDAFVLPSHHESFGMVFLEALACGKPVIATRCGGPEDFVERENGLLVGVGQPGLLAAAIVKLKSQIKQYQQVKIRQNILKKYSSKEIIKKLLALYKSYC